MTQWMSFVLLVVATTIVATESRAIPAEPISVMLNPYGNPIVFLREKRTAVHPYPHRAMMFTGYYRPVRRSGHDGQATGVFAQGNAVSGEAAFFGGMQTPHLRNGPEPIEEQEVSSAEAQAAPAPEESYDQDNQTPPQQDHGYQLNENHPQNGQYPQEEPHYPQDEHHHSDKDQNHHKQGGLPPQEQPEAQPAPALTTEATLLVPAEEPSYPNAETPGNRPKVNRGKKTKKPPVVVEEDDDDDEDEEDDDEPTVPFVPFKGNRRRQNYPNLNNYFPMVFSFPGVSTRAGSSGSPPGAVTAIANSYSTGKGGVASSVATAYGGSPNGKKKRPQVSEE